MVYVFCLTWLALVDIITLQEIILTVTNAFEGTVFVNQTAAALMTPAEYVTQLFPNLNAAQIQATAAQYKGLGSNAFVNSAIMGECERRVV